MFWITKPQNRPANWIETPERTSERAVEDCAVAVDILKTITGETLLLRKFGGGLFDNDKFYGRKR